MPNAFPFKMLYAIFGFYYAVLREVRLVVRLRSKCTILLLLLTGPGPSHTAHRPKTANKPAFAFCVMCTVNHAVHNNNPPEATPPVPRVYIGTPRIHAKRCIARWRLEQVKRTQDGGGLDGVGN